ncbi:Ribose 1,5-bisphosphate isomerase [Candidatus Tiddalikarchaeum anstoanum]|nr:Ribose 1,5-bisphosphate isomerase [Candidatus Tiddalikarchaeum anstoanum]
MSFEDIASRIKKLENTAVKIKKLQIQGSTAIAKSGVLAFGEYVGSGTNMRKDAVYAKTKIMSARPTEPMLKNAIDYVIRKSKTGKDYINYSNEFIKIKEKSEKIIAEKGAALIKNGMNIFTHCHSSSVIRIFKKAKEQGKKFNVVCFETRPLYQGRITAKELLDVGIHVTFTIDSAMVEAFEVYPPDLVLVGCDAITKTFFVNKIGTDTLANMCKKNNVPMYAAGETFKYRDSVIIENRSVEEVWPNAPKKLEIWNPAFDTTSNKLIKGYITERGILRSVSCSKL